MLTADHYFFSLGAARAIKETYRGHVRGVKGARTLSVHRGVYHIAINVYLSLAPSVNVHTQSAGEGERALVCDPACSCERL